MRRPRTILKDLSIDEVSGCDSGANPLAKIVLMKRANPTEAEMPIIEKALTVQDSILPGFLASAVADGKVTKADLGVFLDQRVVAQKRPDESIQKAFVRLLIDGQDHTGAQIYKQMRSLPGLDHKQREAFQEIEKAARNPSPTAADDGKDDPGKVFLSMVNEHVAKTPNCTRHQAIDALLKTPHGLASFRAAKQQDRDRAARASPF